MGQSGCTTINGVDDGADLQRTTGAMSAVGMGLAEQTQV